MDIDGKLIGINSAIASPTGSYAGYSFTIPVNIVKKIIADMMKYGTVQRAYLGIQYPSRGLSEEQKKEFGVTDNEEGVYVIDVPKDGAAAAAGIKKGDRIIKVNDVPVVNARKWLDKLLLTVTGDKINVTYVRGGKEYKTNVTLRNSTGTLDVVKSSVLDKLGAELARSVKKQQKN